MASASWHRANVSFNSSSWKSLNGSVAAATPFSHVAVAKPTGKLILQRTEIITDCARKQHGVLRDDRQPLAKLMEANLANVHVVDLDAAVGQLVHAEEGQHERRLA